MAMDVDIKKIYRFADGIRKILNSIIMTYMTPIVLFTVSCANGVDQYYTSLFYLILLCDIILLLLYYMYIFYASFQKVTLYVYRPCVCNI